MRRYKSHPSYTHDMFRTKFMVSLHLLDFRASRKDINKIFIVNNIAESIWYLMKCYESTWVLYHIYIFFIFFLENILNIRYQKDFYPKIKKIVWILQTLAMANFYSQYTLFNPMQIHLRNVWNFLIILFAQYVWILEEWNF